MSEQQLINAQKLDWFKNRFRPHFDEWVVDTAQRMVNAGDDVGVAMPAFIWLACGIDWLAGFRSEENSSNTKSYTGFVGEYFPQTYNPNKLYDSLRNGLIHSFTIKKSHYALIHRHPELHLAFNGQSEILNLENFFKDWVDAKNKFFEDIEQNADKLDRAYQRHESDGFLGLIQVEVINNTKT